MTTYSGQCFCGAVRIEATGAPIAMGYCHCGSCRAWSASPVNGFTLWRPDAVRVVSGTDRLIAFEKTPRSQRMFCGLCGGHLMTRHPELELIDVFAATLPALAFRPDVHVNYVETVLPMRDGLPKLRDFPRELGGSGETVAE